jgi:hypothetical protein
VAASHPHAILYISLQFPAQPSFNHPVNTSRDEEVHSDEKTLADFEFEHFAGDGKQRSGGADDERKP